MANPKKKEERTDLEFQAWEMRRRGQSVYTIGAALGVPHGTVSRMLKRVGERKYKELAASVEAQKMEQTEQLDHVLGEALEAWDASKEDAETQRTITKKLGAKPDSGNGKRLSGVTGEELDYDPEQVEGGLYIDRETGEEIEEEERARRIALAVTERVKAAGDAETSLSVVQETTTAERKGQTGDPRHLQAALAALEAKRRIWGLDAPKADVPAVQVVIKTYQGVDVSGEV